MINVISILIICFSFPAFSASENFMVSMNIVEGLTVAHKVQDKHFSKFEIVGRNNLNVTVSSIDTRKGINDIIVNKNIDLGVTEIRVDRNLTSITIVNN